MCQKCLETAKKYGLTTVWIFPNGHMLCVHWEGIPHIDEWPAPTYRHTLCGKPDDTNSELSKRYRL